MESKKRFSVDFFQQFHNRDTFFEKITEEKDIYQHIFHSFILLILFAFLYGIVMGCYNGLLQSISSGIKVPILFTLIIIICFPAFFVIQAILGSKLKLSQMLSIILSGFVLTASIMVSFAPIVLFFLMTGDNYAFIKLLHVAIFIVSGLFGMRTIIEALKFSCERKNIYPKVGVQVFKFWIVILAFVGAQLSWSLRPFIGAKGLPFQILREQEGNFYKQVISSMGELFTSNDGKNVTIVQEEKSEEIENSVVDTTNIIK